jgi:hypothetical protein
MQPGEAAAHAVNRRPLSLGKMMLSGPAASLKDARLEFGDRLAPSAARVD